MTANVFDIPRNVPDLIIFEPDDASDNRHDDQPDNHTVTRSFSRFTITRTIHPDLPSRQEFAREFDELVTALIDFIYPEHLTYSSTNSSGSRRLSNFNPTTPALTECLKLVDKRLVITNEQLFHENFDNVITFISTHQYAFAKNELKNVALQDLVRDVGETLVKRHLFSQRMRYPMFPASVNYALNCYAPDFPMDEFAEHPHLCLRLTDSAVIELLKDKLAS